MPLTKDFKETVRERALKDRRFRRALLSEAADCFLAGDVATGKAVLRDYVHATVGFEELGRATKKSPKSLLRMLGPSGNPQASNLFAILEYLQKKERIRLEVARPND
ncbi:MAG: transcriptional regulator [Gammaproteobacteria bacterium]